MYKKHVYIFYLNIIRCFLPFFGSYLLIVPFVPTNTAMNFFSPTDSANGAAVEGSR